MAAKEKLGADQIEQMSTGLETGLYWGGWWTGTMVDGDWRWMEDGGARCFVDLTTIQPSR
jgi:hypothetical protein